MKNTRKFKGAKFGLAATVAAVTALAVIGFHERLGKAIRQPAGHSAQAAPTPSIELPSRNVFITVGQTINDRGGDFDPQWAVKNCFYLHSLVEYGRGVPTPATCMMLEDNDASMASSFDSNQEIKGSVVSVSTIPLDKHGRKVPRSIKDIAEVRQSGQFDYWINLLERSDRSFVLTVQNWKPQDDTDYRSARWTIRSKKGPLNKPISRDEQMTEIERMLTKFVSFEAYRDLLKTWVMSEVIDQSKVVKIENGVFVDRATSKMLPADEAYRKFVDESPKQKHFLRTVLEISAVLGMGAYAYWTNPEIQDFEKCEFWECLKYKFTTTKLFHFDDNIMRLNGIDHIITGASSFLWARNNGYGAMESFMFSFTASAAWEFLAEAREVVSLNDMVFTGIGGPILGEVFHQFSGFFARGERNLGNRLLSTIFGPSKVINEYVFKERIKKADETGDYGFPKDVWHHFELFMGGQQSRFKDLTGFGTPPTEARTDFELGVEGELINIQGAGTEGKIKKLVGQTPWSDIKIRTVVGPEGLTEIHAAFKMALFGYYNQDIAKDSAGNLKGYSFFIGDAHGIDFESLNPNDATDRWVVAHVLGSTINLTLYRGKYRLRATLDVFGDFAQIRTYALDEYAKTHDISGARSIVVRRHDFLGWGVSGSSKVVAERGPLELGSALKVYRIHSINGLDPAEFDISPLPRVTNDFNLSEQRRLLDLWIAYTLPGDRVKLSWGYHDRLMRGDIRDTSARGARKGFYGRLSFLF